MDKKKKKTVKKSSIGEGSLFNVVWFDDENYTHVNYVTLDKKEKKVNKKVLECLGFIIFTKFGGRMHQAYYLGKTYY